MEIPGPDGFLLSSQNPLHAAHLRLNEFLLAEEQRQAAVTPFDVARGENSPSAS